MRGVLGSIPNVSNKLFYFFNLHFYCFVLLVPGFHFVAATNCLTVPNSASDDSCAVYIHAMRTCYFRLEQDIVFSIQSMITVNSSIGIVTFTSCMRCGSCCQALKFMEYVLAIQCW
jgi:hypothetical protein